MDFKNTIWNCSRWTDEMMYRWQKRCIDLGYKWLQGRAPSCLHMASRLHIDSLGNLGTGGCALRGLTEMRYEDIFPILEALEQGTLCHIHRKTLEFITVTPEGTWLLRTALGEYKAYHPANVKIGEYRTEDQKRTDSIVAVINEHLPDIEEGIKVDIALHLNLEGLLK